MRKRNFCFGCIGWLLAAVFFLATSGCVNPSVRSGNVGDELAAAQATLTGTYKTIGDLARSHSLTQAEYQRLMDSAEEAETYLAAAKVAKDVNDATTEQDKLKAMNKILLGVDQILQDKIKAAAAKGGS